MKEKRFPRRVVGMVSEEEYAALLQETKDGVISMSTLIRTILDDRRASILAKFREEMTP